MGMSRGGGGCEKCRNPLENPEAVIVTHRCARRSAFDGYQERRSDWSAVQCVWCGVSWRTKAKYVSARKNAPEKYWNMTLPELRAALGIAQ